MEWSSIVIHLIATHGSHEGLLVDDEHDPSIDWNVRPKDEF